MTASYRPKPVDPAARALLARLCGGLCLPAKSGPAAAMLVERFEDGALLVTASVDAVLVLVASPADQLPDESTVRAAFYRLTAKDTADVLAATTNLHRFVVFVGGPPLAGDRKRAPQLAGAGVSYGQITLDGVRHLPAEPELAGLAKGIDAALAGGAPSPEALEAAEREAERDLGEEARFRVDGTPWAVMGISAAIVCIWILEVLWGASDSTQTLARMGGNRGEWVAAGDWWRLLSAGWLHAGLGHVAGNIYGLVWLGIVLENVIGTRRFLLLYALSIACAEGVSGLVDPTSLGVGASGGVFGVMGALFALGLQRQGGLPRLERTGILIHSGVFLAINLVFSLGPGVGMAAHLGGLALGALLVSLGVVTFGMPRPWAQVEGKRWLERTLGVLALGSLVLQVAALGLAWQQNLPWELSSLRTEKHVIPGTSLVWSLPRGVGRRHGVSQIGEWTEHSYGNAWVDPVILALSVVVRLEGPQGEALDRQIEADRQDFVAHPPKHRKVLKPPEIVHLGGRPWVFLDLESDDGVRMPRWFGYVGGTILDLELSFAPGAEDEWSEDPERWVRGIR